LPVFYFSGAIRQGWVNKKPFVTLLHEFIAILKKTMAEKEVMNSYQHVVV
jgi:hypothetical protein